MNPLLSLAVVLLVGALVALCRGCSARLAGTLLTGVITCSAWTCHAGEVSFAALAHRQCPPAGCPTSPPEVSFDSLSRRQPAPAVVSSAPVKQAPMFQPTMVQPQWSGVTYSYPAHTYPAPTYPTPTYSVQCYGNTCRLVKSK